ncbi:uncharacterized protein [Paramormyrops kingsleyae]|uniref:uncharacterized protein n=1 Tax=Paramormyrops kingsleyae TaxID=1676925 RepID=UPI003B96B962
MAEEVQSLCRWSDNDTLNLIRWRVANEALFTGKRNSSIKGFEAFVREYNLEGKVAAARVKRKWENLKQKYKDLRNPFTGVSTEGGEVTAVSWKWYTEMDEALGGRPLVMPPTLIASDALPSPVLQHKRRRTSDFVLLIKEIEEREEHGERDAEAREEKRLQEAEDKEERLEQERLEREERREDEAREREEKRDREAREREERRDKEAREREERRDREAREREERRDREAREREERRDREAREREERRDREAKEREERFLRLMEIIAKKSVKKEINV